MMNDTRRLARDGLSAPCQIRASTMRGALAVAAIAARARRNGLDGRAVPGRELEELLARVILHDPPVGALGPRLHERREDAAAMVTTIQ